MERTQSRPGTNSTLVVTDSTLVFGGVWVYNVDRARVAVEGNRFEWATGNPMAMAISDVMNSSLVVAHNSFNVSVPGLAEVFAWQGVFGTGLTGSRLFFANNVFAGEAGIVILPDSFNDVSCLAVNNDMSQTTTPYVWDNTSTPCKVVGKR